MAHVIELFVANHCPTCPEARARIRQFAASTPDVVVIEHNVDESLESAVSYGLFATPAVVIDGDMVLYGVPSLAKLADRCHAVRTQRSPAKVTAHVRAASVKR